MIYDVTEDICPKCGEKRELFDWAKRIVRSKARATRYITIPRLFCPRCKEIHRKLPDYILPYKQYETEIIRGVLDETITCETYGFEDYPCEMTMKRWKNSRSLPLLL